jgi:hypothetical protein
MEWLVVVGQNLQLFHSGLGAHPFYINAQFLLGAAGHYEQLLLAICESCKLEQGFLALYVGITDKSYLQNACFFLVSVEVNQPIHINQTGIHRVFFLAAAWLA